jgi:hypothetical protein
MIIFENGGEIDPRLITTFGVNVKESDNPIGFFGTGLKYALSILIRHGCSVIMQSGEQQFEFGKTTIEVRGKPFEFVTMNGQPLGFTTEVGKQWALWMAYRELYCNAQDEGGRCYKADALPSPQPGITRAIVGGDEFAQIAADHGRYFLAGEPFITGEHAHIHHGQSMGIYYRKVMVGSLGPRPTLFTYNILSDIDLTEDRTIKYSWQAAYKAARAILTCHDADVIRLAVTATDAHQENQFDFDHSDEPSAEFMEVVGGLIRDRISIVNRTAVEKYKKHTQRGATPDAITLNKVEQAMLSKALRFCADIGFDIKYEIVPVESLGPDILGLASDNRIYISQRAFMTGTKCVAGTLIEEHIHLKHHLLDCSRSLQNYLLDRMVSLGELATGEPL